MRKQDGEWIAVTPLDLIGWKVEAVLTFIEDDQRFYGGGTFVLWVTAISNKEGKLMERTVFASEEAVPLVELRRI